MGAAKVPEYNTGALSISRSSQMTGSLTDDPDWVEGERLEEFYATTKQPGDIQQAMELIHGISSVRGDYFKTRIVQCCYDFTTLLDVISLVHPNQR